MKSRHIAPGQVKRSDLAKNAVNSSRVANGSLNAGDFAAGQLPIADTPAQVLSKIKQVDGPGSGLDADQLDGRDLSAFAQVIHEEIVPWDPPPLASGICTNLTFALPEEVVESDHLLVTYDFSTGSFLAGQLTSQLSGPTDNAFAIMCNNGPNNIDQPPTNVKVLVLR